MILLAALLVIVAVIGWQLSTDVLIRSRKHRKVVIELRSGETFEGVLAKVDRHSVVLASVRVLGAPETQPTRIDGDLLLPRSDLKYLQKL